MGKTKKEKEINSRQMKQPQPISTLYGKKLLEKGYTEKKLSFDLVKANLGGFYIDFTNCSGFIGALYCSQWC